MSVTAIIPHYWDSREANLRPIVAALLNADATPETIIIWNNTPYTLAITGAQIINAGKNWGIAARFAAAYLARTEYILFQDNDVMVQPGTLRNLMAQSPGDGEPVELQGRVFGPWEAPYSQSIYVDGRDFETPQKVDIGLSRISLMRRSTAMRLAAVIPPDATDDDIWTSRHCRMSVIPYREQEGFTNLPESEGLCKDAVPHVLRRDALVRQLWGNQSGERRIFESTVVRV